MSRLSDAYHRRGSKGQNAARSPGRLFLVVVEGENTEVHYFEAFKRASQMSQASVKVVHPAFTDPVNLVRHAKELTAERLRKSRRDDTLAPFDEVWVVCDSEAVNTPRPTQIRNAVEAARVAGLRLAVSSPSFEVWLLLHIRYTSKPFQNGAEAERELKKDLPSYDKSWAPDIEFIKRAPRACENAQRLDEQNVESDTANPSTQVHRLVTLLISEKPEFWDEGLDSS